jgi:TPR repeat protein
MFTAALGGHAIMPTPDGSVDIRIPKKALSKNGKGVLQDYSEAVRWYRLSAENGYASAQDNLGNMYNDGRGVLQDYSEALKWYRLAAEQGYASAQNNLGTMYDNGQGVLQDKVKAHMWYNISAANGDALGGENRELIANEMTPADISQAQAMARECMSSGYSDCGW